MFIANDDINNYVIIHCLQTASSGEDLLDKTKCHSANSKVSSKAVDTLRIQESPADAGIPARRKNDEKNCPISKL